MSRDLVDSAVEWLPHVPGWGALGLAALAYFRAGRIVGRAETRFEVHSDKIEELETRADAADDADAALTLKLAEVPKRDEVRQMFADQRDDTRAVIGELREDLRALGRG